MRGVFNELKLSMKFSVVELNSGVCTPSPEVKRVVFPELIMVEQKSLLMPLLMVEVK
jgi:hypothetical protein